MSDRLVAQSAANAAPGSLLSVLGASVNTLFSSLLSDPGLRIDGGSASAAAEAQTAFYANVNGTLVTVAAGTNLPALVGTVANAAFGLFVWTINSSGTIAQLTLATGASLGAITIPEIPDNVAVVGALLVNPTGTGAFVGGTTALDDATVVPNAVFFDGNDFAIGNVIKFYESGLPKSER